MAVFGASDAKYREPPRRLPQAWTTGDYVRALWANTGRAWVETNLGMAYDGSWSLDDPWIHDPDNVSQRCYTAYLVLMPITRFACEVADADLLDELCEIWAVYAGRLITLATFKTYGTHNLDGQGPESSRTLPRKVSGVYIDNLIAIQQGLAPAYRLLRHVAGVPAASRTADMLAFLSAWAEVLMSEQAHRRLAVADTVQWSNEPHDPVLLMRWSQLTPRPDPPSSPAYHDAFIDGHWLLALNVAEALAAYELDPTIYAWPVDERADCRAGLDLALAIFQERESGGHYFAGDFSTHGDYTYAGETGAGNPHGGPENRIVNVGIDVSHYHRIPLVLRGLFDLAPILALPWPTRAALRDAGDHMAREVWNGDAAAPLIAVFSDGSDGWTKTTATTGWPPAALADTQGTQEQRSLIAGSLSGWGAVLRYSPRLQPTFESFLDLADDGGDTSHRERYCYYNSTSFDRRQHPVLLLFMLAQCPELLS